MITTKLSVSLVRSSYSHQGDVDLIKDLKDVLARSSEGIFAARNGRVNQKEEGEIEGRHGKEVENEIDQI